LALEHAENGIRVNAVAPGEVNTPMIKSGRDKPPTVDELQDLANRTIPMKRLAEPQEIAEVVLFLASERSSYMTGSVIPVDAGYIAR
jgi:NAD(P)-dependent dehydrogenase (short-subunit alcohol dehydrogenase family)